MPDLSDVERIVQTLPETTRDGGFAVKCVPKPRGFAWTWMERVEPKRPRVPRPEVLAVRTADLRAKDELLAADPEIYFTEPHYRGYPAVLVRLPRISKEELTEILTDAWRSMAPKALVREFDGQGGGHRSSETGVPRRRSARKMK